MVLLSREGEAGAGGPRGKGGGGGGGLRPRGSSKRGAGGGGSPRRLQPTSTSPTTPMQPGAEGNALLADRLHDLSLLATQTDQEYYLLLRQRLDQLDYRLPFQPDSAALVQQLLADLLATTETARTFKSQLDMATAERDEARDRLQPLQQDLSKLTLECNHLHLDIIRMADERDAKDQRARQHARQLEAQIADLHFLTRQHKLQVEVEQGRAEEARKKAEEAYAKLAQLTKLPRAQVRQPGTLQAIEQRIDLERGLEPVQVPAYLVPPVPVPEPVTLDMLKIAEARIDMLTRSNTDYTHKNADLSQQILITREQLAKREREITRLASELEVAKAEVDPFALPTTTIGGHPSSVLGPDATNDESVRLGVHSVASALERIKQLEGQVGYLNEHIDSLERELTKAHGKQELTMDERVRLEQVTQELGREKERNAVLFSKLATLEKSLEELAVLKRKQAAVISSAAKVTSTSVATSPIKGQGPNEMEVRWRAQLETSNARTAELQRQLEEAGHRLAREVEERERLGIAKFAATQRLAQCEKEKDNLFQALKTFEGQLQRVQEHAVSLGREKDAITALYEQMSSRQRSPPSPSRPSPGGVQRLSVATSPVRGSASPTHPPSGVSTEAMAGQVDELKRTMGEKDRAIQALTKERDAISSALHAFEVQLAELQVQVDQVTQEKGRLVVELERAKQDAQQHDDQNEERQRFIREMDQERDRCQRELDSKAERIAQLERLVRQHEEQLRADREVMTEHQEKIALLNGHLSNHDIESSSLQKHLDKLGEENDALTAQLARESAENGNLVMDLTALTRENQTLHGEMAAIIQERDHVKGELEACERQLQWVESNIQDKESERASLLVAYRKLIAEHERMDMALKAATEDINRLRMELILKDKSAQALQVEAAQSVDTISALKLDLQAYEKQVQALSRTLASSERSLSHANSDKARIARELESAKQLGLTIDKHRDDIHARMTQLLAENQGLEKSLKTLDEEREVVLEHLRAERGKVKRLEVLLNAERTRKFQASASPSASELIKERRAAEAEEAERVLQSENQRLQDQLAAAQQQRGEVEERYTALQQQFQQALNSGSFSLDVVGMPGSPSLVTRDPTMTPARGSALEERLRSEINSTQKDVRKYSTLIELKQKEASSSSPAIAAIPGPGSARSPDSAQSDREGRTEAAGASQEDDVPLLAPPTSAVRSPAPPAVRPEEGRAEPSSQYVRDGEVLAGIARALGGPSGPGVQQ